MQAVHLHCPQNVFQHQPIQVHPKYVRKVPSFKSGICVHEPNKKTNIFTPFTIDTFYNRQSNQQQTKSNQENYIPSYTKKKPKTNSTYFIYIRIHLQSILFCTHRSNSTSSNYPFLLPLKPNERLFSSPPKSFQYLSMYDCHQ